MAELGMTMCLFMCLYAPELQMHCSQF